MDFRFDVVGRGETPPTVDYLPFFTGRFYGCCLYITGFGDTLNCLALLLFLAKHTLASMEGFCF